MSAKKKALPSGERAASTGEDLPLPAKEIMSGPDDLCTEELTRIQEQLQRKADELELVNSISALVNASLDLETTLDNAIESIMQITKADLGIIYRLDPAQPESMMPIRYRGISKRLAYKLTPLPIPTSLSWQALRDRQVIHIPDLSAIQPFPPIREVGIRSFITIPLFIKETPLGCMNLGMRSKQPLRMLSIESLSSIGNQIGVAIAHAEFYREREQELEERRSIEFALRESEALYRQVINTSPEAIGLTDTNGNYLLANDLYARLFGFASSEAFLETKPNAIEFITPEFFIHLQKKSRIIYAGVYLTNVTGLMRRRDGSLFMADVSVSLIRNAEGKPYAIIGAVRDVTERQRYQEALLKSEERYRILAEAAHDQIFIVDKTDRIAYANKYTANLLSLDAAAMVGKPRTDFFKGEYGRRQLYHLLKAFKSGKPQYEENWTQLSGRTVWFGTWMVPILDTNGRISQILGVARDITEYKETARKLADSEQRFREIVERSSDGYYFFDTQGVLNNWNQAFLRIFRLEPGEMEKVLISGHYDPEIRTRLEKMFTQVKGGKNITNLEINIPLRSGEPLWVSVSSRRVMKEGIVTGVEGFFRDITEQRATAEALKVSEARYRSLFDSVNYEVYSIGLDGRFRECNAAFQMAWGTALGHTVSQVIKDRKTTRTVKQLIKQVFTEQRTVQSSLSVRRPHGVVHYTVTISPILTGEGNLIGLVGLNVDVTDHLNTLHTLRTVSLRLVQVQEEERRRIAREIHDSLGQLLTALQLELTAAIQTLDISVPAPKALNDALTTIEESITLAQNLCYDLRPPLLDDFGLDAALRDYLSEFQEKWGIAVHFRVEELDHVLDRDAEAALFRIAQEALTNVLKHAHAKQVQVHLGRKDQTIFLRIQDNGCGFAVQQTRKRRRADHYGLMTMNERIELLGGELQVESHPGSGTTITALLPITPGEKA